MFRINPATAAAADDVTSLPSILLLSGSPGTPSRSATLLEAVGVRLRAAGMAAHTIGVRDLPAQELLYAEIRGEAVRHFAARVAAARAIVVATPVYKASLAGALKVLLDVLPEGALADKPVLSLATAGSSAHFLAIDFALKPVLATLGARHQLGPVFATDTDLPRQGHGGFAIAPAVMQRLDEAAAQLIRLVIAALPNSVPNPALSVTTPAPSRAAA
jgi:FMN reductase